MSQKFFPGDWNSTNWLEGHTSDSFVFVYKTWHGDFEFIALLDDITGSTTPFVGLMVRERVQDSITSDARNAYVFKTDEDSSAYCTGMYRSFVGEGYRGSRKGRMPDPDPDYEDTYLRILRYGDQVSLYCRPESSSEWTFVWGTTLTGFGDSEAIDVGMAATSRSSSATVTFELSNVSLTGLHRLHGTSWLGNSLPGGRTTIPYSVSALHVDPDGTLYLNSLWDEKMSASILDSSGEVIRKLEYITEIGQGLIAGYAVATSDDHVYLGMSWDRCEAPYDANLPCYLVRRYEKDGVPSPLPYGEGWDESMRVVSQQGPVMGLAIVEDPNGVLVYVSDYDADVVRIYDEDLNHADPNAFEFERPEAIAADPDGTLWIIRGAETGGDPAEVAHIDPASPSTNIHLVTSATEWLPNGVAVSPTTGHVWIADDGPDQQIKVYDPNTAQITTFGTDGGIYGGAITGAVDPDKINGPVGVGIDDSGNIYVAGNGPMIIEGGGRAGAQRGTGTELRSYESDGTLRWERFGLETLDPPDDDPNSSGEDLYTLQAHYEMDYSQKAGQEWTYKGLTIDRFRFRETGGEERSHDGRLWTNASGFGGVIVRRLEGDLVMYATTQYATRLGIYRFEDSSEIAIPSGLFHAWCYPSDVDPNRWPFNSPCQNTPSGRFMWIDSDGDGLMNDFSDPNDNERWYPEIGQVAKVVPSRT